MNKHPYRDRNEIILRRAANGVITMFHYSSRSDEACTPDKTFVFTDFADFSKFFAEWWPESEQR